MNLAHLVRAVALVAVALGGAATVTGLALPWTLAGSRHPDLVTIAGVAFLGPLLSGLCALYARTEPRRFRLIAAVAGIAGLAAGLIAVGLIRLIEPGAGIALGGPLTVVGTALSATGWAVGAFAGPGSLPAPGWRPWLAVGAAAALMIVGAGLAIDWAREGRFVSATTVGRAPEVPAPQNPAWPLPFAGVQLVGVHGDLALLRAADGIRAIWLVSGTPAWQYLRSDLTSQAAGLVDGAVVVAFGTDDGVLVTALDAGTGAVRFAQRYRSGTMATVHAAGPVAVLASAGNGDGGGAGDLLGIDARGGDLRWRWTPARNGGPCDVTGLAASPDTVAVALRCRAQGVDDVAVGLAAATGGERWSWHAIQHTGPELRVFATGDGFVTVSGPAPQRAVHMDGVTGTVGSRHDAAGTLAVAVGTTLVYAEPSPTRAHLTAVDVVTGAVRWDVGLAGLGAYQPVAGAATDGTVYLLWRDASGRLRLTGSRTDDGGAQQDRAIACTTRCPEAMVAAAPGHAVVATHEEKATLIYLSAA